MGENIGAGEFEEKVLKSDKPVLVDFSASWCGPCQAQAPIIDELSSELQGKADVYKVDIDQEHELANQYQVMSIPTLIVFKGGKIVKQFNGVVEKKDLTEALKQ